MTGPSSTPTPAPPLEPITVVPDDTLTPNVGVTCSGDLGCDYVENAIHYSVRSVFEVVREEKTNGEYTMLEGSLYPILYKLEDAGYITSYTVKAGVRRVRKFYHIEESLSRCAV